jgi:hypothetical protein
MVMFQRIIFISSFIVAMMIVAGVSHAADRGPMFALSYAPYGVGGLSLTGNNSGAKGDSTSPESGSGFSSVSRMSFNAGYYYEWMQADIAYTKNRITDQVSDYPTNGDLLSGTAEMLTLRFGKRFSMPGDTSYSWLFAGVRRYGFDAPRGLSMTAYGYLFGYSGFYSFGLAHDFEFVIALDASIGSYRFEHISTDINYDSITKQYSILADGGVGVGVQYEPYRLSFLVRVFADYNNVSYKAGSSSRTKQFSAGEYSAGLGFEIRYVIPGERYEK